MKVRRISRWLEVANHGLLCLAAIFLTATVGMVIANVVARYLLGVSLTWSAELARYTMIWSAFLAASVLVNRRQHLSVDLLGKRLHGRMKRLLDMVMVAGSMIFFLIVMISGVVLVHHTGGQMASSIERLPMNVVYSIVPLSAFAMLLNTCFVLMGVLRNEGPAK